MLIVAPKSSWTACILCYVRLRQTNAMVSCAAHVPYVRIRWNMLTQRLFIHTWLSRVSCQTIFDGRSMHYRKPGLCPVLESLLSAKYRALGETWHSANRSLPSVWHSAKYGTRQSQTLPSARHSAKLGTRQRGARDNGARRRPLCRVPSVWHSAKYWLCRVPRASTRQNIHFAECQTLALGKINFFLFFATNFFY